eukprot:gb/GECG01009192.1/.p1 GENE.gb/GECG01009192.1/~~gb/GECG01009192.1/.p1  ORF type:complete len:133 (+),score=13.98 gb/GECG01009192.1/:1-399(+)
MLSRQANIEPKAVRRLVSLLRGRRPSFTHQPTLTRSYVGRYYDLHPNVSMPKHRSNAEEMVNEVPPIKVNKKWAVCDGGGGATGHPAEWIQLDNRDGATPAVCKYCGLRFVMDKSKKEDDDLKQKLVSRTFP